MRKASLKDIGVTWTYWLPIACFLGFAALGVWLILDDTEKDKSVGYVCTALFSAIAVCGILWPILRTRERQGILIERVRTADLNCDAVLFPASRVKHYIAL